MGIINIDGNLLRKMIVAGSNELTKNKQLVDSLNVFPVPDGDTGTNMSLTVQSAAKEASKLKTPNIYDVAKAASSGALRGARGNSGVIVSQLFRGFAKGLEGKSLAGAEDLSHALQSAAETAYKAVMKPKEGTILTVAKAIGDKSQEAVYDTDDIEEAFKEIISYGHIILEKTTDMLPELKQAGVVDAGGKGLLCILEGALQGLYEKGNIELLAGVDSSVSVSATNVFETINTNDIKFTYCTEFFININNASERTENNLKNYLNTMGDSIVLVVDDDIIKIHVHTNHPGSVLEKALTYGSLSNLKIENMKEQHTSRINFVEESPLKPQEEEKEIGFVAVCAGAGLKSLFENLGVSSVIEGGQTMNPSAEDIVKAINSVHAKNVIVLPNNKNIILAAEQAKYLVEGKTVVIIPTKSVMQGVSALINFSPMEGIDENIKLMTNAIGSVKSGQITYAVRDTVIDGKDIKEGDFLCMEDGKISVIAKDLQDGAKELIDNMVDEDSEIVSIYYGEDTDEGKASEISDYVSSKYPDVEVEVHNGEQPLYYYLISVE